MTRCPYCGEEIPSEEFARHHAECEKKSKKIPVEVEFYIKRFQVQFFASKGGEWVRFYIDENGRIWALFGSSYQDLFDGEFMDITHNTEWLKGFTIVDVKVYEYEQ